MSNRDGTRSDIWPFSVVRLKRCQEILKARGPAGCRPWGVGAMRTWGKVSDLRRTYKTLFSHAVLPETVSESIKDPRPMTTKSSSDFHFPGQGLAKTWFSHHAMGIESTLYMNNPNFPKKTQ